MIDARDAATAGRVPAAAHDSLNIPATPRPRPQQIPSAFNPTGSLKPE